MVDCGLSHIVPSQLSANRVLPQEFLVFGFGLTAVRSNTGLNGFVKLFRWKTLTGYNLHKICKVHSSYFASEPAFYINNAMLFKVSWLDAVPHRKLIFLTLFIDLCLNW